MTQPTSARGSSCFARETRTAFLAHLAETSNVAASARAAGVPVSRVYAERRRSAAFRTEWHQALCEGYARLEAELLAEALRPASGHIKDVTVRSRALKTRLGTTLLALHRASVRGDARPRTVQRYTPAEAKAELETRFATMRARMGFDADK